MCIACEQEAMWFAYLQRRGLITADGRFVEEPPSLFAAEPVEPQAAPEQVKAGGTTAPAAGDKPPPEDQTAG
jgi:hypothetical protein